MQLHNLCISCISLRIVHHIFLKDNLDELRLPLVISFSQSLNNASCASEGLMWWIASSSCIYAISTVVVHYRWNATSFWYKSLYLIVEWLKWNVGNAGYIVVTCHWARVLSLERTLKYDTWYIIIHHVDKWRWGVVRASLASIEMLHATVQILK